MIDTGRPHRCIRGPTVSPLVDGVAEAEHGHVLRAVLTDGGDTGEEGLAGVPGGLNGQYLVGVGGDLISDTPVAEAHVVGMGIDHARHQGLAGIIEGLDRSAFGRGHLALSANCNDLRSLDENRAGGEWMGRLVRRRVCRRV